MSEVKTPRKTPRKETVLTKIGARLICHFKNEAARRKALGLKLKNSESLTEAVVNGLVSPALVSQVHLLGYSLIERDRPVRTPRAVQPVVLVTGRKFTREEFAMFITALAGINPKGFRQPSAKAKNWSSTSGVEQAAICAGLAPKPKFERSERGKKKLEANEEMKRRIAEERINGINPKYLSRAARERLQPSLGDVIVEARPELRLAA